MSVPLLLTGSVGGVCARAAGVSAPLRCDTLYVTTSHLVAYDVFQAWVGTISLERRHGDEG